jgi:hypothetical protein
MPDLRERLRAIESTQPPDLWAEIEARELEDRPELGGAEIVPFEPRRPEWPRRLAAVAVAVAVFFLGTILVWRGFNPSPGPSPTPVPAVLPDGWERCANDAVGYSVGHPGDWFTTDVLNGEQDPGYACQWFNTVPFGEAGNEVPEGFAYPLEVGVRIGSLDDVLADETTDGVQILLMEDTSVGDQRAVRLEVEFGDSPIVPAGTRLYEYLVELTPDSTLRIFTADQPGIAGTYDENRSIVDLAVSTIRFADPLPPPRFDT